MSDPAYDQNPSQACCSEHGRAGGNELRLDRRWCGRHFTALNICSHDIFSDSVLHDDGRARNGRDLLEHADEWWQVLVAPF